MALLHAGALPDLTLSQLMLGQHGGAMGGAPVFMLLLGGVYLVGRRVISPRIPLSYLGTVALLTLLFPRGNGGALAWMTAQLCSGGLVLGAVFMCLRLHYHTGHTGGSDPVRDGLRRADCAAALLRLLS
ncbi:MAG: RnfABCDGE type electron transport complex subunit D [Lawsonibacter sp.]